METHLRLKPQLPCRRQHLFMDKNILVNFGPEPIDTGIGEGMQTGVRWSVHGKEAMTAFF